MGLIGSAFFGFAQNTIHGFQNTLLNSVFDKCHKKSDLFKLKGFAVNKFNLIKIIGSDIERVVKIVGKEKWWSNSRY